MRKLMLKPKPKLKLNMRKCKLKQKRTVVVYAPVRAHYHDFIKVLWRSYDTTGIKYYKLTTCLCA